MLGHPRADCLVVSGYSLDSWLEVLRIIRASYSIMLDCKL